MSQAIVEVGNSWVGVSTAFRTQVQILDINSEIIVCRASVEPTDDSVFSRLKPTDEEQLLYTDDGDTLYLRHKGSGTINVSVNSATPPDGVL
jgi:hypothetical protein